MSRCFPFLPQTYVKKPRAEDVDSLKKEKEREKKHKKDRRDKEKRESKEKKEKERSEGKHGDKKEKKEKHRDKKKDKDKDKEKEKKREREKDRGGASEEKSLSEQKTDGGNNKEKVFYKGRPPEQIPGVFGEMDKEKNRTHVPDIKRDGEQSANIAAPKAIEKNNNIHKNQNNHVVHNPVDAKFVVELGKRVRDGAAAQSSEKISVNGQKKDERMVRLINASSSPLADRKERSHERRSDNHRLSGQGIKSPREMGGAVASQNFSISVQMSEGMPRPPKMSVGEKMAVMEKIREKESKHVGSDRHIVSDLQRSKTSGKDKDRDREKKNGERTKKAENKVHDEEKLRERAKESLDAKDADNIVLHVLEEVNKIVPSTLYDKKRKTLEPNGFLHENETRQIKLPRQLSPPSYPSSVENGRIVDGPQSMNQYLSPGRQGHLDVVKVDKPKKHKPNGIPEKKPNPVPSMLDEASLELLVEKAMARSPHPDLKYLDKVLKVPKFEDLVPPAEDEEWLFGSRNELQKPSEAHSDKIKDTTPQVWSEAMPLDSVDIIALPYVVPF
ncbi:hypothetical protein MLD38_017716 [Melastoma candidum]|uniref:Uncharacterized protein n=1 Tax=Melastoma candidum TaxID=119954 RepID=A0ACB9QRH6_9MYRT|nr:hypothetical protein MLD38_017716 [Melastoma candidum]